MQDRNIPEITPEEMEIARGCISTALECGADKVNVTLSKSLMDLIGILDGNIDKVTRCLDRSLDLRIFADSRFGSFSTNDLRPEPLREFISKAVATAKIMQPDSYRDLPARERVCRTAITGREAGLADDNYSQTPGDELISIAKRASLHSLKDFDTTGLISEEGEYSEEFDDTFTIDSEGFCGRHTETSFEYGVEVTVQDDEGNRYSTFWWDSSPRKDRTDWSEVGRTAYRKAIAQMNPEEHGSFCGKMVVSSDCAAQMVKPLLSALNGFGIQQHNSFLEGKLGQKVFSEGLTIEDEPLIPGRTGGRLFDSEGVATRNHDIIRNGVVKEYFLSTYMAGKLGMEPTAEDAFAPVLRPWPEKGLTQKDILAMCGSGILVTGFNGGNYDRSTGDFSYGIEGFAFENGTITHPVSEMLVTGNFIRLWNNFCAAGEDARKCMSKHIPTLAFDNVDFNG